MDAIVAILLSEELSGTLDSARAAAAVRQIRLAGSSYLPRHHLLEEPNHALFILVRVAAECAGV
jgi:hypothetical protein